MIKDVCFACGIDKSHARMERCHVIPKTLGGKDVVYLCKECHNLAPNTTNPDMFYLWCSKQSWIKRRWNEILQALKDYDVDHNQMSEMCSVMISKEFSKWFDENAQLHGHNARGPVFTASTAIASLLTFIQSRGNE